jgi:hypothetical protein
MSAMTPVITCADLLGCMFCGISEDVHPAEVYGLGHMDTPPGVVPVVIPPKGYVAPLDELVMVRKSRRMIGGYQVAEIDGTTGEHRTDLVITQCRCGAKALATPSRVVGARCGACSLADAEKTVTERMS